MKFHYPGDVSPGPLVLRLMAALKPENPMPTDVKRLTAIPDLEALAVLGYDVTEDGQTGCVVGPARRLAKLVEQATAELSAVFGRNEWNAIADVMNGCADLYDHAGTDVPALMMVRMNLQDSPGIEKKWKIKLPELTRKLEALTTLHGEAILCAVRWAWRHCDDWDHQQDEWWRPEFRKYKESKRKDGN